MGDRGEDMKQMTTGRIRTRVAALRSQPIWYSLYPVSQQGSPIIYHNIYHDIHTDITHDIYHKFTRIFTMTFTTTLYSPF